MHPIHPHRRASAGALLLSLACVVALAAAVPAAAATPPGGAGALVRVANLALGTTGTVDAELGAATIAEGLAPGSFAPYRPAPAGGHDLVFRSAGTVSGRRHVTLRAGQAYTVALIGTTGSTDVMVLTDRLAAPPAGTSMVRAVNASPTGPAYDIGVKDGQLLFGNLRYGTASDYLAVPGNGPEATIEIRHPADHHVLSALPGVKPVPGRIVSFFGIGASGETFRLIPVLDAAGAAAVPNGGIATGAGGAAGERFPAGTAALLVVVLAPGAAALVVRRRAVRVAGPRGR